MKFFVVSVLLSFITNGIIAAPEKDLISDLPGMGWTPDFKQYSGYLKALDGKRLHYWFTESENDPKNDPVLVWLNGGPGCSSINGLLTENGPFRVSSDGKNLMRNVYSWNKVANIIFLEAPAGVGFSYSEDKVYVSNDDSTAFHNYVALRDFFEKYPEYQENDFYITGESYAGIYIPTLSLHVLSDSTFNFKGIAIGNGFMDRNKNDNSLVYFLRYHGVVGELTWHRIWGACCGNTTGDDFCDFVGASLESKECQEETTHVTRLAWHSGLNTYNLYAERRGGVENDLALSYNPCRRKVVSSKFGYPFKSISSKVFSRHRLTRQDAPVDIEYESPCDDIERPVVIYLNRPEVRKALHIPQQVQRYTICSSILNYTEQYDTMAPQFHKAISSKKLRILVYNGDVDMACNFIGDEWFVDELHANKPQQRKQWYYVAEDYTEQIAGYFKTFAETGVTFLTVKGSGHYVPTDKPIPAIKMLKHFLSGKPYDE